MMRVIVTNDDGIDAPGLRALVRALRDRANVITVAPAVEWSGAGHNAPSSLRAIRVERRDDAELGCVFVVHSHPAECVRLALTELCGARPDLVIAGINRGGNVGVDVYYSGTVAAAREAAILGCPAVAVSQFIRKELPDDWPAASDWTRIVLDPLLSELRREAPPAVWNINLPHLPLGGRPRGIAFAPVATAPLQICYERVGAVDATTYRYCGAYLSRPAPSGSDVAYLFDDWVTISVLGISVTACPARHGEFVWPPDGGLRDTWRPACGSDPQNRAGTG